MKHSFFFLFCTGFEAIDNFFGLLLEHIVRVLDARDRGELVNGRLLPPPHDPANVNILNQLNMQSRLPQENDVNGKGRPGTVSPSPVIKFSPKSLEGSLSGDRSSGMYIVGNNNVIASKGNDENGGAAPQPLTQASPAASETWGYPATTRTSLPS